MKNYRRYPEYKDSGIEWLGEIPAHWEIVSVKRFAEIVNGATPRSSESEYWNGNIAWATPDDLGQLRSRVLKDTSRHITKAGYASCGTTLIPPGSLIISTRAPIGHLAIAGRELCINQGCRGLILNEHDSSEYRYYSILAVKPILQSLGEGSTFRELPRDTLANVVLSNPPQKERKAIADFLDRETAKIDALVEKKERLIELLKEKRTALISHAVTKGLDPNVPMKDSGIEWLGQIPAHWEVKPFKQLFVVIYRYPTYYNIQYVTEGIPEIRGEALTENGDIISLEYERYISCETDARYPRTKLQLGDLVMSVRGTMGKIGLVDQRYVGANITANLMRLSPKKDVSSLFLRWFFLSEYFNQLLNNVSSQTTIKTITVPQLSQIPVTLPPQDEQRTIAAFLDRETARIDALIEKIRKSIDLLREYRTALISAAVTGEIDVRGGIEQETKVTKRSKRTLLL
ncbi:MAG: restriction endonuclease subunit S [Deltaproteobacteria bacterium]|nr:restriction endonuclease subunit S [Deltaproteobacteria bacterium]